jgi:hypothetical protein
MQITLDIPKTLQIQLANAAQQQNLSLNDYIVQCLLQNSVINKQLNSDTQQAIEDARAGRNMQKISLDKLKESF